MDNNYAFLSDYLNRVAAESMKVDQQTLVDDDSNEFFNTIDEQDQQQEEPGIQYGFADPTELETESEQGMEYEDQIVDEDQNFMDTVFDDETPDYAMQNFDEMGEFDSDFDMEEQIDYDEDSETGGGGGGQVSGVGKRIATTESGNDYKATNKHSSATGKYQFLWGDWGDSIKKVTGVKSKQEFLNNPNAQDKYFAWYEKHYLAPEVKKLQAYNKQELSDEQLMRLVHFRGAAGAKKYLQGKVKDKPESYNMSISKYIGKKQYGGKYQTGGERMVLPGFEDMPLYVPKDGKRTIKLIDKRKINPASGKPFKNIGQNTADVDESYVSSIIAHAKAKGIDPYTALAIAYQESNIGQYDNAGQVLGNYWKNIPDNWSDQDKDAAALVAAFQDKMKYAKQLGYSKKGEAYQLQAYQGYGNLYPDTEVLPGQRSNKAYFGIPVSKENPLNLKKNPAYGKTVISLRDSILKRNPQIQKMVKNTPAFKYQVGGYAVTPEMQYEGLNNSEYDEMIFPLYGENEFRGLDNGQPVYLEDETGKKKVLKGRKDRTKMKGKVYEKRLNK